GVGWRDVDEESNGERSMDGDRLREVDGEIWMKRAMEKGGRGEINGWRVLDGERCIEREIDRGSWIID
ncbi:hypothetical protein A2U01_0040824, partial [Trifolium medium]|nr:hypothetical protein [Trifolium medium]